MPDLSGLSDRQSLDFILNSFFRGRGPKDADLRALVTGFIRLIDKAVREYEMTRLELENYVHGRSQPIGLPAKPVRETPPKQPAADLSARTLAGQIVAAAASSTWVVSPLFRATGHMENFVTSLFRAMNFANAIRRSVHQANPYAPSSATSTNAVGRVRAMRDAIQHIDDDIRRGRLGQDEAHTLMLKEDAVELAGTEIRYHEIADWLRALHRSAKQSASS